MKAISAAHRFANLNALWILIVLILINVKITDVWTSALLHVVSMLNVMEGITYHSASVLKDTAGIHKSCVKECQKQLLHRHGQVMSKSNIHSYLNRLKVCSV